MTTLELTQHPAMRVDELLPYVQRGEPVVVLDHGREVFRIQPPGGRPPAQEIFAFRRQMTSPPYPGNEVVEARRDDPR